MASKPIPRIPGDVLRVIFDFIEALNDDALAVQRLWLSCSLVCKEWARIAGPYLKTIVLPTASSVQCFATHIHQFLLRGTQIRGLHIEDVSSALELSVDLFLLALPTLQEATIPLHLLPPDGSRAFLAEVIDSKLEKVRMKGDASEENGFRCGYPQEWRDYAAVLLLMPSVATLELSDIAIKGQSNTYVLEFGQIKTLHLRNVCFLSEHAATHLVDALSHELQHLELTHLFYEAGAGVIVNALCEALGSRLLSLTIDRDTLAYNGEEVCFEDLTSHSAVLEYLKVDGIEYLLACDTDEWQCFLSLPSSLRYCSLGSASWRTATALLEKQKGPNHLSNLQRSSVIWLQTDRRAELGAEVDEYNARRSRTSGQDFAYAFQLRWADERENQEQSAR